MDRADAASCCLPDELQGLARDLSPTSRDTARFVDASLKLFPQADALARCATETILPTGDLVIDDQFTPSPECARSTASS